MNEFGTEVSYCFTLVGLSPAWALKRAVLMSLIVTCEQQNRRFLDLALSLWRERNPEAIPIENLPEVD